MNAQKKLVYYRDTYIHLILYIIVALLSSLLFQLFTDLVLNRYELFWAANYDDLVINLFTAQITIIILPLSLFGFFTEMTNEVYLGQSVAEYMYLYKGERFLSFRYKELVIGSMILTLIQYILMSKKLLAAELITVVLNTITMLVTFFSWFELRIKKEKLHTFIQKQLYTKIAACTKPGDHTAYEKERILTTLLSKLKDWVANGGDFELTEAMQFYENLYLQFGVWDMAMHAQNPGKKEPVKELMSAYQNTDDYFDEMVADLLRKKDYYRALRCSKHILETIVWFKKTNYYHPNHYYYRILIDLFRKISQTEIMLLGDWWFCDYINKILKIGNPNTDPGKTARSEGTAYSEELQRVRQESYLLVYELLMAVWQNDNLTPEYKQKQIKSLFIFGRSSIGMAESVLCVIMKLMGTKIQAIIDTVVENTWNWLIPLIHDKDLNPEQQEEREFLEKAMVLILMYGYYLAVYTGQNITIPKGKIYIPNIDTDSIDELDMWEVLTDSAWKWSDEMKKVLDRNNKLGENFRRDYRKVIYDIMLYSALACKQWPVCAKNYSDGYDKVLRNFNSITDNDNFMAEVIHRYKRYRDLFGAKDQWTDQMIREQFYEFKKMILRYYMDEMKRKAEGFDKEAFLEDLTRKIWEELLADQRFECKSSEEQISDKDLSSEVAVSLAYLVSPYKNIFDAHYIKELLYGKILRQNTENEEADSQERNRTYNVLSLEWREDGLSEEETEQFIKEEELGVKVPILFYPINIDNIHAMKFQTYEEAYEFVKSEYRKVVFRMAYDI